MTAPVTAGSEGRAGTTEPLDTLGMFEAAASMPEQIVEATERARGLENLPERDQVEHVVVLGMGGSGIAGEVLQAAAGPYLPVPVLNFRSYNVPAFVDESSLVFAVSFSGDTEETVEAVTEAALQGARVVVITTGGELGHRAESWDAPIVRVQPGIPTPRAGLGALSIPPLVILEEIGLFPGASHWIDLAVEQLSSRRDRLTESGNEAEELARRIGRTIPLIYGSGGIGTVAAHRWKNQVNENAKVPAFSNSLPELCHNEVCGWGQHGDLTRQVMTVVNLRHDFEHPQIGERYRLVNEVLDEVVARIEEVRAEGEGELAQLLDLMMFGDFTSLYMAFQEGIDPGPVPVLDHIKFALAGTRPEGADPE
jgi:glucose/mannose-6-phosphate isomerase